MAYRLFLDVFLIQGIVILKEVYTCFLRELKPPEGRIYLSEYRLPPRQTSFHQHLPPLHAYEIDLMLHTFKKCCCRKIEWYGL